MSPPTSADPGPARGRAPLWRKLALAGASLLALLVAFELACRLFEIPGLRRDDLDPLGAEQRKARIEPHPYLAYANKRDYRHPPTPDDPHQISHNSMGFRGPETTWEKPPGVFRIACLGGSSTYGFGPSSDATTWPARLQAHLNELPPEQRGGKTVEVINGGCQGYSTFEILINLELRMVDLSPDLVVVYESINDMRCALYPHVRRDNTHWRAVFPVERPGPFQRVLERSYAFLAWRRYATDWWEERKNLGSYVIVDFGKYADDFAQPDPGDLGFRNFQRNLVSIVQVARGQGAEAVFVTQGLRPKSSSIEAASSKDLQLAGMERMSDILRKVAAERSVPLVDAERVLEARAEEELAATGNQTIFTNEVHLQDAGADLLARTIAEGLLAQGLIR